MKNISRIFASVLASAMLFGGCVKETFPEGGTVTADQVASSSFALEAMLNSITASMVKMDTAGYYTNYNQNQVDFGLPSIHLRTEHMLEDVATMGDDVGYNWFSAYAQNLNQGSTYILCSYFWDCYYAWIKICNDIIASIDPETASEETLGYLGQAYAYRAMCYLDMARMFEPKENGYTDVSGVLGLTVPIVTETTTGEVAKSNPRAPRAEMYAFILSDLEMAATCLEGVNYSYTAPTLGVVYGMYARAYIEMGAAGDSGAYASAAEYARKAISESGATPLTQAQWEDPSSGFNSGGSNNSWMWGLTVSAEQVNNLVAFNAHFCSEATWGYVPNYSHIGVSRRLYDGISDKDFRKHSWLDPERMDYYDYKLAGDATDQATFLAGAKDYAAIKFRPAQGEVSDNAIGNTSDHPLMRVEEMYFIEMEATAQTNLAGAQAMLNDFMKFRITDGSYNCTAITPNLDAFLSEMLFQKRAEFWGEGILFFDYKRLDAGITRGYEGTNHAGVHQYNSVGRSPQWNVVITRGEFQNNTGITPALNNPDPSGTLVLWK